MDLPLEIDQTRPKPVDGWGDFVPKTASAVHQLTQPDLILPDLVTYHALDTAMARNAQWPDTLEAANHRLAMICEKYKDNPEVIGQLQNFVFRDIVAFDEWVLRPHLVPKDPSKFPYMSDTCKAYLFQGDKTRGMKTGTLTFTDPSALTREQEQDYWVYLRRDNNWVAIPWSPAYFENDLSIPPDGIGNPKIRQRQKGFATYLTTKKNKSLADIFSCVPPSYIYNEFTINLPLNNREKAFLLNLLFAGFRHPKDGTFDCQDILLWSTAVNSYGLPMCNYIHPDDSLSSSTCVDHDLAIPVPLFSDMV